MAATDEDNERRSDALAFALADAAAPEGEAGGERLKGPLGDGGTDSDGTRLTEAKEDGEEAKDPPPVGNALLE